MEMQFGFDDDNLNEERKNTEPTEKAKEGGKSNNEISGDRGTEIELFESMIMHESISLDTGLRTFRAKSIMNLSALILV